MTEADSFWKGRSVLVTGSEGFLGSWMVKDLRERGAFVVGLAREHSAGAPRIADSAAQPDVVVRGSIVDYALLLRTLKEHEIEAVLHLAAQAIAGTAFQNPLPTFDTNIRGTWQLLEACRQASTIKRILVASSDKAYGPADGMPYVEETPLLARTPYEVSKSCADMIAQTYHVSYGLPVCITRAANFYGGGDLNFSRIVPGTIRSALSGKAPVLRSDGTMIRDYIYVRDVTAAYLLLAQAMDDQKHWGKAYNFSLELQLSVLDMTQKILVAVGRSDLKPIILNEAKAEIPVQYLSSARARRELGWKPQFMLDDSLIETVDWYKHYLASAVHA
jgi:CDP-glucose 4,6-dehydratase